jgi:NhaP-type Na+/H+ or K+/H+ antiporter
VAQVVQALVDYSQLLIGLPIGVLLVWAAFRLHRRMFRRPGERLSVLDAMVLATMAAMALLLALSLGRALG